MLTGFSSSSLGNKWSHPNHVKKESLSTIIINVLLYKGSL